MGEGSADDARVAEDARRTAAEAQMTRAVRDAFTGEGGEEAVRQLGLIYGGLIGIAVIMVQPLISAGAPDVSSKISVIAFAVAIPLLAALVMVNRQEVFRHGRTPSRTVAVAQGVAQSAGFIGIVAGFWHIYWVAGVVFLGAGIVALGVHSAGWWRLERDRQPSGGGPESPR